MKVSNVINAANKMSRELLEWAVDANMSEEELEQFFDSRNNWIREFAHHLIAISQDAPND